MRFPMIAAAVVAAAACVACGSGDGEAAPAAAAAPKNVIFFLGDGYGIVPMTAARIYAVGEDGELDHRHAARDRLRQDLFERRAGDRQRALDGRLHDGRQDEQRSDLAMYGDTRAIAPAKDPVPAWAARSTTARRPATARPSTTLLELAKAQGRATGVVTTTRVTHATPAATYAHVCHRDAENDIARQRVPGGAGYNAALGSGVDVLMGGGSQYFLPYDATRDKHGRPDGRDLRRRAEGQGLHLRQRSGGAFECGADRDRQQAHRPVRLRQPRAT